MSLLGTLVVKIAAEMARYKADLADASNATSNAAKTIEKSSGAAQQAATRLGGSMGTAADAAMALAEAGGVAGGVLAAFGVGMAAAGYAAYKGAQEQNAYQKALILTGNVAGTTASKMQAMAANIDKVVGTHYQAAAALTALAATGQVAGNNLQEFAQTAIQVERVVGTSVADTAKVFAELGEAPVKASLKLNESMNYLTAATFAQIKAAEELGDKEQAASIAQNAYSKAMDQRTKDIAANLGYLDRAWIGVKDAAKETWDAMLGLGRQKDPAKALDDVAKRIAEVEGRLKNRTTGRIEDGDNQSIIGKWQLSVLAGLKEEQFALQEIARMSRTAATAAADRAEAEKAKIKWLQEGDQYRTKEEKLEVAIAKIRNEGAKAGATELEIEKRINIEREKAATKPGRKDNSAAIELEKQAALMAKLGGVNADYQEQLERLVRMKDAQTLSEEEYIELVTELIGKQPMVTAIYKDQADAQKDVDRAYAAATKTMQAYEQAQIKTVQASYDEVEKAQAAYDAHEKLASVLQEEALARLEIVRAAMMNDPYEDTTAIDQQIANKKKLIAILSKGEMRDSVERYQKDLEKAGDKAADSLEKGLTDALMRGFENGKGYADNFRDVLEASFKTMVLRPTVNGVMGAASDAASGALSSATGGYLGTSAGMLTIGGSTLSAITGAVTTGIQAGWAGTSVAAAAEAYTAAGMTGTATGLSAGSAIGTTLAAIPGWGWAAMAAIAVTQMKGTYVKGSGYSDQNFDAGSASGTQNPWIDRHGGYNPVDMFVSPEAKTFVDGLQKSYLGAIQAFGGTAVKTTFGLSTNSAGGSVIVGGAGTNLYQSSEFKTADAAATQLSASRAVFTALQASDMPAYLAKVFNGITASTATQADINNATGFATALKTTRDALTETRLPLDILKDTVATGFKDLGTSAAGFKTDFVAAIDAGLTPEAFGNWKILEANIAALGEASGTTARSLQDIANERKGLQDQFDTLTMTNTQLLTKQRDALDASNQALFDQVKGFEKYNALASKFAVPETVAQATTKVTAAGLKVDGLDTAGIAAYVTAILNGPGMKDAAGKLTDYGLQTVAAIDGVSDSLITLGESADTAAAKSAEIAAANLTLQQQIDVLRGTTTQKEVDRANTLATMTASLGSTTDDTTIALQKTVWGLEDMAEAARNTEDAMSRASNVSVQLGLNTSLGVAQAAAQTAWDTFKSKAPGLSWFTESQAVTAASSPKERINIETIFGKSALSALDEFVTSIGVWRTALAQSQQSTVSTASAAPSGPSEYEQRQQQIASEKAGLQDQLNQLTLSSTDLLKKQRDALDESNRALFDQVQGFEKYNSLASRFKVAETVDQATTKVTAAGFDVSGKDTAGIAAYVTAILNGEGMKDATGKLTAYGINTVNSLEGIADSLITLGNAGDTAAAKLKEYTNTKLGLEQQIDVLTGKSTQIDIDRANALAAVAGNDDVNGTLAGLVNNLYDLKAAATTTEAAAAAAKALADTNKGWQNQLDVLTGKETERSIALRDAGDDTTRSLMKQVYAQQDLKAATEAAAQAAAAMKSTMSGLASTRTGLQVQLLDAQGKTAEALALKRATEIAVLTEGKTDKEIALITAAANANFALEDQITATNAQAAAAKEAASAAEQAAEQQANAAKAIKDAWQSATDSILGEVARIRALMGGGSAQSMAQAQAAFAIATGQARAGDVDAAKMLPELSKNLLGLAEANATSMAELRRIQGQTAASLSQTGLGLVGAHALNLPKFDVGTDYVPRTQAAIVHRGEMIVPAAFNPASLARGGSGQSSAETVAAFNRMAAQMEVMRKQLDEANRQLQRIANGTNGNPENPMPVKSI